MPSPFKPSSVAQSLNIEGKGAAFLRQPANLTVDPDARSDGRNPLFTTNAESLLAQASFLLKRELNETDAKYFVAPGGDIYYLNGEEKKLRPPSPPPIAPPQAVLSNPIDLRGKRTRVGDPPSRPYPTEQQSLGHAPSVGIMDQLRRR